MAAENERVRAIWEKQAPRYDRGIEFMERLLFAGAGAASPWTLNRCS